MTRPIKKRPERSRGLKAIFIALSLLLLFPAAALSFDGPLQYKNQFPLAIPLATPYLESAVPESSLSANLSYSSVYLVKNSPEWSFGLDMEITDLTIRAKKSFGDSLEIGLDVPLLIFDSGVMDGFLSSYHRTFGFPDYGRSARPQNSFLFDVRRNGNAIVEGKDGIPGLGDLRLTAKKTILTGDPAISLLVSLDLPTGDAKAGFGNGSLGAGAAFLLDKEITGWLKSYWNMGWVFPGDLRGYETVRMRSYFWGGAAFEAEVKKGWSALAQLYYERVPWPRTEIGSIDRNAVLFAAGGRYAAGANVFELSFTEDPSTSFAPDVSFTFSYKRKF